MMQDMPFYPRGTLSWGESTLMGCVCDGGYTGPDCSLRFCPNGDDPATVCDQTQILEQVQQLDFALTGVDLHAINSAATAAEVIFVGQEFSLSFKTPQNVNYTTKAIAGVWGTGAKVCAEYDVGCTTDHSIPIDPYTTAAFFPGAGASTQSATAITAPSADTDASKRIETAIEMLPEFAVRDVTVVNTERIWATNNVVNRYIITFHHLNEGQNSYGAQNLLHCHLPNVCAGPGCQPRVSQPHAIVMFEGAGDETVAMANVDAAAYGSALTAATGAGGPWVKIHTDSVLSCPTGADCTEVDEKQPMAGIWIFYDGDSAASRVPTKKVWVKGYGESDSKLPDLTAANNGGISGASWGDDPKTLHSAQSNGFVHVATNPAAGAKIDISDVVPNTWITVADLSGVSTDMRAVIMFQPVTCSVSDVTQSGSPMVNPDVENVECSGRGECDRSTGRCECFEGYTSANCGKVTTVV
jgi:hypothetical protein